jgi:hypothetical protein
MADVTLEVQSEADYRRARKVLSAQDKAPAFLRALMGLFEGYREARRMGWSRSWNKRNLTVFQAFKLVPREDHALITAGLDAIRSEFPEMGRHAEGFIAALIADPSLMGFIFFHDHNHDGRRLEGATLSLGRKVPSNARVRDRLDLIIEREVTSGAPAPALCARLYVDPFDRLPGISGPLILERTPTTSASVAALFDALSQRYRIWSADDSRSWRHWTQRYIDYFGPREDVPAQTAFPPRRLEDAA